VAKKYVPLLVRLNKSNMDGMEKTILVLRWILFSHTANFSTNVLYGKEHRAGARNAEMTEGLISFLAFLAYSLPAF
jgi:hypothetical protein